MKGYQRALMNLRMRIGGCEDTKKTHKNLVIWHKDVSMLGYNQIHRKLSIWVYEDVRTQASTHEPQDIRMWGCKDANKHTWALEYVDARMCRCQQAQMNRKFEDVMMRRHKQAHMNLRLWGSKDARIYKWTWRYKKAWRWDLKKVHEKIHS